MKLLSQTYVTKGSPVFPVVARTLVKVGGDISLARRSRHIAAEDFARQMGVSRATLHRLEKGDAGVSLNTLAMALNALGLLDQLGHLVEQTKDQVALMTARLSAPRRIARYGVRKRTTSEDDAGEAPVTNGVVEGW